MSYLDKVKFKRTKKEIEWELYVPHMQYKLALGTCNYYRDLNSNVGAWLANVSYPSATPILSKEVERTYQSWGYKFGWKAIVKGSSLYSVWECNTNAPNGNELNRPPSEYLGWTYVEREDIKPILVKGVSHLIDYINDKESRVVDIVNLSGKRANKWDSEISKLPEERFNEAKEHYAPIDDISMRDTKTALFLKALNGVFKYRFFPQYKPKKNITLALEMYKKSEAWGYQPYCYTLNKEGLVLTRFINDSFSFAEGLIKVQHFNGELRCYERVVLTFENKDGQIEMLESKYIEGLEPSEFI